MLLTYSILLPGWTAACKLEGLDLVSNLDLGVRYDFVRQYVVWTRRLRFPLNAFLQLCSHGE